MSLQTIGYIFFGGFVLAAVVGLIVDREAKKPKSNVHLPRYLSWDRFADWKNRRG